MGEQSLVEASRKVASAVYHACGLAVMCKAVLKEMCTALLKAFAKSLWQLSRVNFGSQYCREDKEDLAWKCWLSDCRGGGGEKSKRANLGSQECRGERGGRKCKKCVNIVSQDCRGGKGKESVTNALILSPKVAGEGGLNE